MKYNPNTILGVWPSKWEQNDANFQRWAEVARLVFAGDRVSALRLAEDALVELLDEAQKRGEVKHVEGNRWELVKPLPSKVALAMHRGAGKTLDAYRELAEELLLSIQGVVVDEMAGGHRRPWEIDTKAEVWTPGGAYRIYARPAGQQPRRPRNISEICNEIRRRMDLPVSAVSEEELARLVEDSAPWWSER